MSMEVPVDAGQRDLTGQVLGQRYRLLAVIGRGGMATVYRASDASVGREVAVKVLDPARMDPVYRERFLRECRLSAGLSHGNIVRVFDTGETDGVYFIAMELLRGRTLAELLVTEKTLQWERGLNLIRQIGAGLAFAHQQGLVHRDLKPANCFVEGTGASESLKILDFGLAKSVRATEGKPEPEVTSNAVVLGSPTYMAPEQARGQVALQSDIYAVGVMLYRMLAGRPPFRGRTPIDIIAQHFEAPVPWLRELTSGRVAPIELELAMRQCLEKDPGARYASVDAMLAALDDAERKVRGEASPPSTAPDRAPTPPPLPRRRRPVTATIRRTRPPSPPHVPPVLHPAPMPKWLLGRLRASKGAWLPAAGVMAATTAVAATLTVGALALWHRQDAAAPPREATVAAQTRASPVEPPSPAPTEPSAGAELERQVPLVETPAVSIPAVDLVARGADPAGLATHEAAAAPRSDHTARGVPRSTGPTPPPAAPASQARFKSDPYE